jgi:ribosomal protein S28E/S33
MTEAVLSRVGVLAGDRDRTITGPAGGPVQPGDRIALIDVLRGFA